MKLPLSASIVYSYGFLRRLCNDAYTDSPKPTIHIALSYMQGKAESEGNKELMDAGFTIHPWDGVLLNIITYITNND